MNTFTGIVQKGSKQGTALGFPTANIAAHDANISGIYAAGVTVDGQMHRAAVYADQKRKLLEAHLLDFSGDLYGKMIVIELLKKIRESMQFENIPDLQQTIAEDITNVRNYFNE